MQTAIHFILADFGKSGTAWVQRDPNDMDRETTIRDLMSGQIDRPLRVIEVDASEGTAREISEDIARDIAARREPLSPALIDFIEEHAGTALVHELEAA